MKVLFLLIGVLYSYCYAWGGEVYPASKTGEILTPPEKPTPSINGARVVGVRPEAELIFRIPVSGKQPIEITSNTLPPGLSLDKSTGILRGRISKMGRYNIVINAKNKYGNDTETLTVCVGEKICLTPPMGWNSWYSHGDSVSAESVWRSAEAMNNSGLANYGWSYINIDDCWQGTRLTPGAALQPNEKFPDMSELCKKIHSLGLKIGIYSTPWMGTYEGFRGSSVMNNGDVLDFALPLEKRKSKHQLFGTYPGVLKQGANRVGDVWMVGVDAHQWATWGCDYVKMDWHPIDVETAKKISEELKRSKRDLVLSLSNNASIKDGKILSEYANCVRTTGDVRDTWQSISSIIRQQEKWVNLTCPGYWNDPDMLQIGKQGAPNMGNHAMRKTRLTPDEQYTQFSVWCLLSAPLLISADMESIDDFTKALLTNAEVIAVNQDEAGMPARYHWLNDGGLVISKKLADGANAIGVINMGEEQKVFTIDFEKFGLTRDLYVRDLWRQCDIGVKHGELKLQVNKHGCVLLKCKKVENHELPQK